MILARRLTPRRLTLATCAATLSLATACTTDPETGQRRVSTAAVGAAIGAVGGAGLGGVLGGKRDRTEVLVGAGLGAVAGGAIGAYMDKQQRELEEKTRGTGVEVVRQGDDIVLNMPSGITFDVDQSAVKPQFRTTLDGVAQTLASYNSTLIDVYGHTDSTGSDAYNQTLSERRAGAVADYLSTRGVVRARMATRGFGESQPVASNDTEAGRADNRRVEIKVVPVSEQDVSAAR